MQIAGETVQVERSSSIGRSTFAASAGQSGAAEVLRNVDFGVIRRNGSVVPFEPSKIAIAMTKAFLAVAGGQGAASARIRELVDRLTHGVVTALVRNKPAGGSFHIEDVQDQVELALMRSGEHEVARAYVLYREKRAQERAARAATQTEVVKPSLHVLDGSVRRPLDLAELLGLIKAACVGFEGVADPQAILTETVKNIYDGVPIEEVHKSVVLAARARIESDPVYSQVSARLLLHSIRREVLGEEVAQGQS